jgi:hypothetical protein
VNTNLDYIASYDMMKEYVIHQEVYDALPEWYSALIFKKGLYKWFEHDNGTKYLIFVESFKEVDYSAGSWDTAPVVTYGYIARIEGSAIGA